MSLLFWCIFCIMLICESHVASPSQHFQKYCRILTSFVKNIAKIWLSENILHSIDLILSLQGLTCVHVRDANPRWLLWYIGNLLCFGSQDHTTFIHIFNGSLQGAVLAILSHWVYISIPIFWRKHTRLQCFNPFLCFPKQFVRILQQLYILTLVFVWVQ